MIRWVSTVATATLLLAVGCANPDARRAASPTPKPAVQELVIDGRASAVAVEAGRVWVADDQNHAVHTIDAASLREIGRPIDVERNPIAITTHNESVWVGHANGYVTQIDARARRVERSDRVGGSITGITSAADAVWAADAGSATAIEIDPDSGEVVRGVKVPEGVVRIVSGTDSVWVSGKEDSVSRIDLDYHDVRHVYEVGSGPIGLAFDGEDVWVANSDDGTISDVAGKKEPIDVGRGPVEIAASDDSLWVVNQDDATLVEIDDGRKGRTIDLRLHPRGVVAGEGAIWVAGTNEERNPVGLVRVEA